MNMSIASPESIPVHLKRASIEGSYQTGDVQTNLNLCLLPVG